MKTETTGYGPSETRLPYYSRQATSIPYPSGVYCFSLELSKNARKRLVLGVKLASTVMQLHTTDWLTETWNKDDILFPAQHNGTAVLSKPMICRKFSSSVTPPQQVKGARASDNHNLLSIPVNKSLYCLGIVLIELWFQKDLNDLRDDPGPMSDEEQFLTAYKQITQLEQSAGATYAGAVRCCILGSGLGDGKPDLREPQFQREVHNKIISPLEDNLKWFCGVDKLAEALDSVACS